MIYSRLIGQSDFIAFFFFLSLTLITFVFEYFLVLDYVFIKQSNNGSFLFDRPWKKYVHSFFAFFILHNVLGNLYQIIKVDSSIRSIFITNTQSTNLWKFCSACETLTPPRSFHCNQCKICILKRTHHCFFANACIGYKNFRYYYSLLIYVFFGCLYASYLNMYYVWDCLGGFTLHNFFAHTFPFLFWVLGKIPLSSTLICLVSIINFCGCLFAAGLLLYHGQLLLDNQTVFERNKHIRIYNMGSKMANIKESLGSNWSLVLLSPLVPSKLSSDGIHFQTRIDYNQQSTPKNK